MASHHVDATKQQREIAAVEKVKMTSFTLFFCSIGVHCDVLACHSIA